MDLDDLLVPLRATCASMPPLVAMQLELRHFDGQRLYVYAPLAANVNDKGSAFGGSLSGLMTIAGWALATLKLQQAGLEADVYVATSSVRYRAPLLDDLHAQAWLEPDADWADFIDTFGRSARRACSCWRRCCCLKAAWPPSCPGAMWRWPRVSMPGTGKGTITVARLFWMTLAVLLLASSALPAQAATSRAKQRKLADTQMLFSKAMRWGDFEQAWGVVDPKVREQRPLSALELSRYQQVQVSGYSEIGSLGGADGVVVRLMEMRVINRNTMAERTLRVRERWRWDDAAGQWWLLDGLPDPWQGQ